MIFVTVGTTDFDDLVRRIDDLAPTLGEEVICQIGTGLYTPRHCQYFRLAPSLDDYLYRARLIVSHGGLGTVMEVLRCGKPLVGVSNPDRPDRHQDDLLSTFAARNCILWCRSLDDLPSYIARANTTRFATYTEPPCQIHTVIEHYLRNDAAKRWGGLSRRTKM